MYTFSDFIIRLKNASLARRKDVVVKKSKVNKAVALVLKKEGFIEDIKESKDNKNSLILTLRYQDRSPVLKDVLIISKPSLRVYSGAKNLTKYKRGYGMIVVSTNSGIMTLKEADKKKLGGEILFKVW